MRGRSSALSLATLLSALLVAAFFAGCDRYARHRVLTFFFTGVPPLDDGKKGAEQGKAATPPAKMPPPKRRPVVAATRFSHGPYASGACYYCHQTSETGGFRGLGKKEEAKGALAKGGIVPGKLVATLRELCVGCHETKSSAAAARTGLWTHGPVAAGYCTACHAPHAGPEPFFLSKKANDVCAGCHAAGFIRDAALHEGKADCLSCHNPHFGKSASLLAAEHRETW